ncbi:MAG TPA: ATP-grasp domain-containing protein [Candidatus Sulfotelmatobacter sp.]|nr:ATP-grasp domain-containing protein [Candidatus Sulfotelmatobacter sp.]
MKTNVLVFPCGTEIGLEIYRSLGHSTHVNLVGASSADDHGKFVYPNYSGDLPYVEEDNFTQNINELVKKHSIDLIFPAHDSVLLKLAQERERNNLACELIASPETTCEICRSKKKTYQALEGVVPVPKVYDNADLVQESDYPVFLKPDIGQGSKGTVKADSIEDIKFYTKKDPTLLILEHLPGKEYTIDCFTDRNGKLLFSEGRERLRISGGISVNSKVIKDDRFKTLAQAINDKLKLRGVWFFQLKENASSELILMEIGPRVAGTMGLARARGVNLPLLSVFDFLSQDVLIAENSYDVVIDRALENLYKHNINYAHVYLDFDDLVIYEGKVNPAVMAFVYQCVNKKVKVHLLTKHRDDLNETLSKYKLTGVFDELIWISADKEKHTYIKEKQAIFIDDSFSERKEVQKNCGIPVFDCHMIEALMEEF